MRIKMETNENQNGKDIVLIIKKGDLQTRSN